MDKRFILGLLRDWGLALVAAVAIFVSWNLFFSSSPVTEGEAPDFEIADLNGEQVQLSALRGKPVVLNFWATWCGPCVAEIPELIKFSEKNKDVPLLGISLDEDRSTAFIKVFVDRKHMTYPILHDRKGDVGSKYSVDTLPTTYVIDSHGHIAATHIGQLNQAQLQHMLDKAD